MERILKFKKRIYLVDRQFQLRYVRAAVLIAAASSLLTLFTVLWPLYQFRIIRFPDFLPAPFLVAILVAALFNFLMITGAGILLTHRVAGPIFNIVRQLNRMEEGDPFTEVRVRKDDELQYLVRNLNGFIAKAAANHQQTAERLTAINLKLAENDINEAKRLLQQLLQDLSRGFHD